MENEKLESEEFEQKRREKTEEELKEDTILLVKERLGNRDEISSTEFKKMLDIHMIMIFANNDFYELEFLGKKAMVEHYLYEEFLIKRIK